MSESGQRQRVVKALKALDARAIENPIGPGTPDVNYIEGWIELKWLRRWPKNADTIVQLPHFTDVQRRWLRRRWRRGGNVFLLLQCKQEWLLFTGQDAHDFVGHTTHEGLRGCASAMWTRGLKNEELRECLQRERQDWDSSPEESDS